MKITEYKPGIAINVVVGDSITIVSGISLSGIRMSNFINGDGKKIYYIVVKIMQSNGIINWWALSSVHKI